VQERHYLSNMTTHLWLYLAVIAYFLEAMVFVIDKFLLSTKINSPIAYAFYAAVISVVAVVLIPFGVTLPPLWNLTSALVSGLFFFLAMVYLYRSIHEIDVLEATPVISVVTAITTILLNLILVKEFIDTQSLVAFFFLVLGTLMMSYLHLNNKRVVKNMLIAGFSFGVSFVTMKYFFNTTNFVDGLFWTRMGMVGSALVMLVSSGFRQQISTALHGATRRSQHAFIFNKLLSAVAFVTLYYSIKIGSVVFVNALQGFQYVFVLLISFIMIRRMPRLFEKHHDGIWRKVVAIVLIAIGFFLLSVDIRAVWPFS